MNKFLLSVATCAMLTSSAFAQVTTTNTTTSAPVENANPAPVSPLAPVANEITTPTAPVLTDTPVAAPVTNSMPVVGNATIEPMLATPSVPSVEAVSQVPTIDQTFFNTLVDAFNSKNVDSIISTMSSNSVTFITSSGVIIRDKEAIKNHLIGLMTGENPITLELAVDSKLEPKPGVVFTTGSLTKTSGTSPDALETHKETISALVSYENYEWKIVALQSTKVEEPKPLEPVQEEKSQSSGLRTLLALLIGAAAGFMGSRFLSKKKELA